MTALWSIDPKLSAQSAQTILCELLERLVGNGLLSIDQVFDAHVFFDVVTDSELEFYGVLALAYQAAHDDRIGFAEMGNQFGPARPYQHDAVVGVLAKLRTHF